MIEIKNKATGDVIKTVYAVSLRGADLRWANLRGAIIFTGWKLQRCE